MLAGRSPDPWLSGGGGYVGRFAPSPTGPLHAGSLAAALASWLDARAHGGCWLLRIEDTDTPRCVPGAALEIERQLAAHGLRPDAPPLSQSTRGAAYAGALARLLGGGRAYPCGCSRQDIERAGLAGGRLRGRHAERVYPGTCRQGLHGRPARAVRVRSDAADGTDVVIDWTDRRLGAQRQNVTRALGDFVLQRAGGLWAYQLAVVVDDAAQGVTHVVRGEDLADNTPRQIHLQRLLGLPTPRHLHTPLVRAADGEKLSKQNAAPAVDAGDPLGNLRAAGRVLGIEAAAGDAAGWLAEAASIWRRRWGERTGAAAAR